MFWLSAAAVGNFRPVRPWRDTRLYLDKAALVASLPASLAVEGNSA
jgi:hypothetical protein